MYVHLHVAARRVGRYEIWGREYRALASHSHTRITLAHSHHTRTLAHSHTLTLKTPNALVTYIRSNYIHV